MSTVFETRLIGNIGRDATVKTMERGVVAINFPVAHNKNWIDRKTGKPRTRTTWVNCTIWKREDSNLRVLDFLKKGALVEVVGTPYAKSYHSEDGVLRTEIRLNVSNTNILRASKDDHQDAESSNMWDAQDDERFQDASMNEEDY